MSSLADTIRREDEAARRKQAELEAEAAEADDETGGLNPRTLAAFARARGDVAEAAKWEAKAAAQDAPARKPAAREDVFAAFRSGAYFGLEVKR